MIEHKEGIYPSTHRNTIKVFLYGIVLCISCGWLFYEHIAGILLLSPLLYPFYKKQKEKYRKKMKYKLTLEFRDGMSAFLAALEAGFSAENALEEANKDLGLIYDEKTMIRKEFNRMTRQIKAGMSIENAFTEFGRRAEIEEINNFAEVFAIAKRTGGDLLHIIRSSENIISEKIEVTREIQTMLSGKQFETTIMKWIPLGILLYLNLCNAAYLEPLYQTLAGRITMSLLLCIYGILVLMIGKITNISL